MTSEADYLDLQATRAMARLRQTARTLADEIRAPLDVGPIIGRHPWWSLGSAAVGGFLSGFRLGRPGRGAGAGRAVSWSHRMLGMIDQRVWRVLRSAVVAVFVAEMRGVTGRGAAGGPGTAEANGNGAVPRSREA